MLLAVILILFTILHVQGLFLDIKLRDIMTTVEEMKASLDTTNANLDAANLKLDEIRAFIATLVAGAVTQGQLDELAALAASSASKSAEVLAEADQLDEAPATPE